jgi:translation elongation factor EF-G
MSVRVPVISLAVNAKTRVDQEQLVQGLQKLTAEDATIVDFGGGCHGVDERNG